MLVGLITRHLKDTLSKVNNGFRFIRVETPLSHNHPPELRESTADYVAHLTKDVMLSIQHQKLPLVIWEYGKMFPFSMECMSLEYQIFYSNTTATKYLPIVQEVGAQILKLCDCDDAPIQSMRIEEREGTFTEGRQIEFVLNMDLCASSYLLKLKHGRSTNIKTS